MAFARFLLSLFVAGSLSGSDGVVTLPPSPVPVPSPTMLPTAADFTMLHITMEANTDKKPTESRKASLLAQIEAELVCEASDPCYIGGIEVVYTSETTTVPIIGEQTTFTWFVNLTAHSSLGAVGETTGNGWAASAEAGLTSIQFQANVLSVVGGTYFTVIDVQATPHAHTAAPSLHPVAEPTSEPTISTLPTPEPTIHTASPSMLITLPPTTIDYAKIYVVMSATCDKKPSNSRTAALQSVIEDSIGCTPSDGCSVDPFRIDYTTSTISTLLGPLNTYTWDVNMTASGPLANVGETTTDKWCRSVESELTSPGFSVSATSVVGATTFAVLDVKAVSRTREPPSMAPTPKTPSGEKPSSIIMVHDDDDADAGIENSVQNGLATGATSAFLAGAFVVIALNVAGCAAVGVRFDFGQDTQKNHHQTLTLERHSTGGAQQQQSISEASPRRVSYSEQGEAMIVTLNPGAAGGTPKF